MAKRKRVASLSPSEMPNRAIQDGLEVAIVDIDTGARLPQVHSSKTTVSVSTRPHRYMVFASALQKFGIAVTTTKEFAWGDANALEVVLAFDLGNVVNQKMVYLLKPVPHTSASALRNDNALPLMHEEGSSFSCCIDHILVQSQDAFEGRTSVQHFTFSTISDDGEVIAAFPKARIPLNKTVGEHQGKIRVEIQAKKLVASKSRFTGLQDVLSGQVRARKQSLIDAGICLEIKLENASGSKVIEYGGAFRPSASTQASARIKYTTDFLYRAIDQVASIVKPMYLSEVAPTHSRMTEGTAPNDDTQESLPIASNSRPLTQAFEPNDHNSHRSNSSLEDTIVAREKRSLSQSTTPLENTSCTPGTAYASGSATISQDPSVSEWCADSPNTASKWHKIHTAIAKYCGQHEEKQLSESKAKANLMAKAELIESQLGMAKVKMGRLRQELRCCEAELEGLRGQSVLLQTKLEQLDEVGVGNERQVEQAIEDFVSSLEQVLEA